MRMIRAIAYIVAATSIFLGLPMPMEAREIRVAVPQLPEHKGIPYGRPFGGNPQAFTIPAIFEGLTYLDGDGNIQPLLATSWERLSDFRWQFKLREGVQFSNGAPFTAKTVQQNLNFVREEQSAIFSVVQQLTHITHINALDPYTIEIITNRSDPFMPKRLSIFYLVEPGQWMALGQTGFADKPVGTGPFQVSDWRDITIDLEAATTSWRQAEIDTLTIHEVNDPTTRLQGLLSGDLDIIFSMGPDDKPVIEAEGHTVLAFARPGVVTLPFNLTVDSPLRDVRVRRALNHAVDNASIVKAILGDEAVVPRQFTPHMAFGYDPNYAPYPYDLERARALMAEAGHAGGFDLSVEVAQGLSSYSASIYQLVASHLARIDVRMEIRPVPIARYVAVLLQGEWNSTLGINLDYAVDPTMDALVPIERHSCTGAIPWYCDQSIMPLLAAAFSTTSLEKRLALTRRVIRRQTERAPGLLLWEKIRFDAASSRVEGFVHDLNFIHYDRLATLD